MIEVLHVEAFEDNYIWLICGQNNAVVIVDPGDATPVLAKISELNLKPVAILCTHHHYDHVGGVDDLLKHYQLPVYGPATEQIEVVDQPLNEGDVVELPAINLSLQVLSVPGHTKDHIAYYGGDMLFCGDTLFSGGCGRLFEGTAEQMVTSLAKFSALPDKTWVYCAHEYTAANLSFALTVEPGNSDILDYLAATNRKRENNTPSLPSNMAQEKKINPFLRTREKSVIKAAGEHSQQQLSSETEVFAEIRRWKDGF